MSIKEKRVEASRVYFSLSSWRFVGKAGAKKGEAIPFVALLFIWSSDHQPSCHIKSSLRSKRFRAVSEERTRNESQTPRENGASKRSGRGRKSRSSIFLCSETKRKRLLRRLYKIIG